MIEKYALTMEFEKCIELREKLHALQSIYKQLDEQDDNKNCSKNKTLVRTKE